MTRIGGTAPIDTTFEICTHRLRREILCLLDNEGSPLSDEEITDSLATVCDDSEQDIAVALQHVHLPKLQEADYIEYDNRNGDVHYRGSELFELLHENDFMDCRTCADDAGSGDG